MKPASPAQTNETLIAVLEVHFERTKKNISALVRSWSRDRTDLAQYENVICHIFCAINQPREDFVRFLNEQFAEEESPSEGLKKSHHVLNVLSQHSTGNVNEEGDILFQHCRQVSSLATPDLQQEIAGYLKTNSNQFLREEYLEMYQQVKKDLAADGHLFAIDVANDLEVPSSSVRASSPVAKLSSEEKQSEIG
ncbi:MAG: hypothetical protein KA100_01925 [Rickettsiales bacterium]|nr:hypothetical protein [Rickettsiales bacterium]